MNKLVWLRNDLRIDDHLAFHQAFESRDDSNAQVHAVYLICDEQWDAHDVAHARRLLVLKTLKDLVLRLKAKGVCLQIIDAKNFKQAPQIICQLSAELDVDAVFTHYDIPLNERLRDKKTKALLADHNVDFYACHGSCLLPPKTIVKNDGTPYQVYTPFKNKFYEVLNVAPQAPIEFSHKQALDKGVLQKYEKSSADLLTKYEKKYHASESICEQWLYKEEDILRRLNVFCAQDMHNYKVDRDIPSVLGTCKLSPYLSLGSLSVRRAMYQATFFHEKNSFEQSLSNEGYITWCNELIWRDFYRHILYFHPRLSKGESFKLHYAKLPWKKDTDLIEAWKQGQTGYPMIDAAMRQLNATGWMHNRMRMLTAVFFSKYMLQDWSIGEAYFMSQLVDGDFAANNGGWQWSSSTGTDAAPYFRLLSPLRQAERFDAQAHYIKTFVPELAPYSDKAIVKCKPEIYTGDYVSPIINIKGKKDDIAAFFKTYRS